MGSGSGQRALMFSIANRISSQCIFAFLRTTAANSHKTCTLTVPPSAIKSSACWERGSSCTTAYTNTLVSKNALALIDVVAVEDESRREGTTELAQVLDSAPATFISAH